MTYRDIYNSAISHIGEIPQTEAADLESAAAGIMPTVVYSLLPLDNLAKKASQVVSSAAPPVSISLDDEWPLEESFFTCAVYYLVSSLTAADDPELSALFYARAEEMRRVILEQIPFTVEKIT